MYSICIVSSLYIEFIDMFWPSLFIVLMVLSTYSLNNSIYFIILFLSVYRRYRGNLKIL